ncbi:hypothetical protein N325_01727, partial [Colius striatus]
SLGMDLAAAVDVTIMTTSPWKIPTGVKGPVTIGGRAVGALLLGRSSTTMLGLFVLPGVIDADYLGEIMIMAHTSFPPIRIVKNQRIAQLIPLEQMSKGIRPIEEDLRGDGGFGSMGGLTLLTMDLSMRGLTLLTMDLSERPRRKIDLEFQGQKRSLMGLLDTGTDSSIIS